MKKSDKKIENSVRKALTKVCEAALDEVAGFKWITHLVNYNNFPESLSVICVFETNNDLSSALGANKDEYLRNLIKEYLGAANIPIKNIAQHVNFDTEEACRNEHRGKWHERFS
ncbi:MAG: Fis family transcriptional regulator [Gammaproteobacteria bacterium]|nr:Fis family transcriptional regulator [Gammaproteobacteria bacterium]